MGRTVPSVLIVGAGPTGLTAALELARRGLAATVIDRREGPTALSKAVGISPHSLEILEPSGAAGRLLGEGLRLGGVEARRDGRTLGCLRFSHLRHRYDFLLALPQSRTETILADRLAAYGGGVTWRTQLTGLTPGGAGCATRLAGPDGEDAARFDIVLGADGAHSAVRAGAGLDFAGRTHARIWSIADFEAAGWPYAPDMAQLIFHAGGDVGFVVPLAGGRFRAVSNTPDALACVPQARPDRVLRTDTFQIHSRLAGAYRKGAAFLAGDAAHVHSPVGARGMNLGIEDAAAFARRLMDATLDGYEAERLPVARRWIARSERILAAAQAANPAAAAARDLAVRAAAAAPPVQRAVLARMAGLRE